MQLSAEKGGPLILPGSGLNAEVLPAFLNELPLLTEIHLTASELVDDRVPDENGLMEGFGGQKVWRMNEDKLWGVFAIIDELGRAPE
jgi:copper homeostasis protein CutC